MKTNSSVKQSLLSLIISAQVALAPVFTYANPNSFESYRKEVGIEYKKPISFEKFFEAVKGDLPPDLRKEMQLFVYENPGYQVRPILNRKINSRTSPYTLELVITAPGDSNQTILRLNEEKPSQIEIQWVHNKVSKKVVFNEQKAQQPLTFLKSLTGDKPYVADYPAMVIMPASKILKMKKTNRAHYLQSLRQVVAAAEAVRPSLKSVRSPLDLIFGEAAWASYSGPCIVAGWPGEYRDGSCKPISKQARNNEGNVICNPALFGTGPNLVLKPVPNNATTHCDQLVPVKSFLQSEMSRGEGENFDMEMKALSDSIEDLQNYCLDQVVSNTNKHSLQSEACNTLIRRVAELRTISCSMGSEVAAICADINMLNAKPTEGEVRVSKKSELPTCTSLETNLPSDQSALSCNTNPVKSNSCVNEYGEERPFFYCECGEGFNPVKKNTELAIGCDKIAAPVADRKSKKKKGSWFKPWMGVTLAGAIGIGIWYYSNKQSAKKVADMWDPAVPVIAPPPGLQPSPTPTPTPTPVDTTRPTPGTR